MSINADNQTAVDDGHLMALPMRMDSDPQNRVMYLSKEVQQLVLGPYKTDQHEERAGKLWADLESFVRGGTVSMCLTPYKAKSAIFGLLDPVAKATFDYRSQSPRPSLRLLGHFLDVDQFVALCWWPKRVRVDWSAKEPLGDDRSKWRMAICECNDRWFKILPNSVPIAGLKGENYVSSKLHSVRP